MGSSWENFQAIRTEAKSKTEGNAETYHFVTHKLQHHALSEPRKEQLERQQGQHPQL